MANDTTYSPIEFLFQSHGVVAHYAVDRCPPQTYLNLADAQEREENSVSTRLGSTIINRDPNGTPGGVNYFFTYPIVSLSRLKTPANSWRYAADNTGDLFRRQGDTQGAYSSIESGLSGLPFSSVVNTCYNSSMPYLFIADAALMLKDSGTGAPTRIGILQPIQIANSTPYAGDVLEIDFFTDGTGSYTTANVSSWASTAIGNVVSNSTLIAVNDFVSFEIASGIKTAFNGAIASVSGNGGSATLAKLFDVYGPPQTSQLGGQGLNGSLLASGVTTFALNSKSGTVAAATVGSVLRTAAIDLSQNNQVTDDDLIILNLQVSHPENVQEIRLTFELSSTPGYASFYKSISPVYYQSGIAATTNPFQTTLNQVFWQDTSVAPTSPDTIQPNAPGGTAASVQQLSPANLSSGPSAWVAVYMRRGDFVPVGSAGQDNYTWADIVSWKIEITTVAGGGTNFAFNGMYLQFGAGPSSYGGVGYDYRYTYYNVNTGTESNGSQIQYSSEQFGTAASLGPLIVLRQAINVSGYYSEDPQVTHVRIYRRGGTLSQNWLLVDQIPNYVGTPFEFFYADSIPDSALLQASTLALDNDPPVTSSLPNPVSTTLSAPAGGTSPNVYAAFIPETITFADATVSVKVNQILVIGTPQNLEEVPVEVGGTGSCQVTLRLAHASGEPVMSFAVPAQPVDLVELAYGQMWWAGDTNNPHYLYYSKPGYPENCGPQNYIPVSQPSDPIMAVINFRGTLFVATLTTWYQIIGGANPYAQPTGSKHGLIAKHAWTQTESSIWYLAADGIREFRGADGAYRSLPIEWLFRQYGEGYTPIPAVDPNAVASATMEFYNNYVYFSYKNSFSSNISRLVYHTIYQRWRNDTVGATTQFYEADTNLLLYSRFAPSPTGPGYAICIDQQGNTDDIGFNSSHVAQAAPIALNVQTPFQDLGKPHFQKQWNTLEIDADTGGGTITVIAEFSDGSVIGLGTLPAISGRQKYQLPINAGLGYEAYTMSVILTGSGSATPPILFQMNIYAAVLAADRSSYDTYWHNFGTEESKLIKEGYFDYTTSGAVSVSLYADGATVPYYTFTLPTNTARSTVPQRVRFPAIKCRLWRCVMSSANTSPFQLWSAPTVSWKACQVGAGYAKGELPT